MKLESIKDLEKALKIFGCGQWVNVRGAEIEGTVRGLSGNCEAFDGIDLVHELLSFLVDSPDKIKLQ